MPLSAQEQAYLRDNHPHLSRIYMSVFNPGDPVYVGSADVGAQAPAGSLEGYETWGAWEFTLSDVSGSISTLEADMTVWVGTAPGTCDVTKRRYRKRTGQVVTIDENSVRWHDYGVLYFSFYKNWEFWPVFPYDECIPATGGGCSDVIRYIDRDVQYTNQYQDAYKTPIANIKFTKRAVFLDGATATIEVDASTSQPMAVGTTIDDYNYVFSCPEAIAVAQSGPVCTFTFDQAYPDGVWIKLTVTDSNGNSQVTYRQAFIHQRTGANAPFMDFQLPQEPRGDWGAGGWTGKVEVYGDMSVEDFPENTFVLIWQEQFFNGVEAYIDGQSNVLLAGYIRKETVERNLQAGTVEFEVATVESRMKECRNFSIFLEDFASVTARGAAEGNTYPFRWDHFEDLTAAGAVWAVLSKYTTLLKISNVYLTTGLGEGITRFRWIEDFEQGTMYDMVDTMTHQYGIYAHLVCNKEGDLYFEQDINSQSQVNRDEEDTRFTVLPTDRRGPVDIAWARGTKNQVALVQISGVGWDPDTATFTPFIAQAPGNIQDTEGADVIKLERQALYNQVDANSRAGQIFAILNNPIKDVTIPFAGNYSFLDIVPQSWLYVSVPASETKRQEAWASRIVLRELTLNHKPGIIQASGVFDAEAVGKYGIIIPVPDEPLDPPNPPPPQPPPDPPDNGGGTGTGLGTVYTMNGSAVARTFDLSAASPTWTNIHNGLTGSFIDMVLDPWSPSRDGYCKRGYAVTTDGVFVCEDMKAGTPTWSNILSASDVQSGTGHAGSVSFTNMIASINYDGYLAVLARNALGNDLRVFVCYSDDGGSSWSFSLIRQVTGLVNALSPRRLEYVPHGVGGQVVLYAYLISEEGNSWYYHWLYKSTDGGATWTVMWSIIISATGWGQAGGLHCPYDGNEGGNLVWWSARSVLRFSSTSGTTNTVIQNWDVEPNRGNLETHTFDNQQVIAWVANNPKLSYDGGMTWDVSKLGPGGAVYGTGGFPYNDELYYACSSAGVFVTLDACDTWLDKTGTGGLLNAVVIVPDWTE